MAEQTHHLSRILCLHGGGTNSRIFRAQCRMIIKHLSTTFRLIFAEAPFTCQAGPEVGSVYKEFGPFKRWLRSNETHPTIHPEEAITAIEHSLKTAMDDDDRLGGYGEWVGLLGFSQGAKVCASLMLRQQLRAEQHGIHRAECNWHFAIILAGRGPLVSLDDRLITTPALVGASQIGMDDLPDESLMGRTEHILYLPTIHVHGLQDPGLEAHRKMLAQYSKEGSAIVMEWEGGHRVPIKTKDVLTLVRHIWAIAYETGVLPKQMSVQSGIRAQRPSQSQAFQPRHSCLRI